MKIMQPEERFDVTPLFSPPYGPKYNDSCVTGNGSIKARAHHIRLRPRRVAAWSCDDIEAARLMANELVVLTRHGDLSPDEVQNAGHAGHAGRARTLQKICAKRTRG